MACEKIVCLSNIVKEGQLDDFFNHSNVTVLTEKQKQSSESFQTGTILSEKFIYTIYIYFNCFIDNNPHISLYIVFSFIMNFQESLKKKEEVT